MLTTVLVVLAILAVVGFITLVISQSEGGFLDFLIVHELIKALCSLLAVLFGDG